jgi:transcriptional regulator with XRE-family HTH domain
MSAPSAAPSQRDITEFLRSCRARITPKDAGLPLRHGTRRVPGLRREEVALLAGVSADYYIRLERGRVHASDAVLDAVARALALNDTEREHLYTLNRPVRPSAAPIPPQRLRPGLRLALDSIGDVPAMVTGRRLDVLAANRLARALLTDFDALPHRDRNMARFIFLDEAARTLYTSWEQAARDAVAALHLYAGRYPDDPLLAGLVSDLSTRDADFRRWWADHNVIRRSNGVKYYHHPVAGDLALGYEAFAPVGDQDQTFALHTAEPGSPSELGLRSLAAWTREHLP